MPHTPGSRGKSNGKSKAPTVLERIAARMSFLRSKPAFQLYNEDKTVAHLARGYHAMKG